MTYPALHAKMPKIIWDSGAYRQGTDPDTLEDDIFASEGWMRESSFTVGGNSYTGPSFSWNATSLSYENGQLAFWLPDTAGPYIREGWASKIIPGFDPGEVVGLTFNFNWILKIGSGQATVQIGDNKYYMTGPGATLFNWGMIDSSKTTYLKGKADIDGNLLIKFGMEGTGPSFEQFVIWEAGAVSKLQPSGLLFVMPPDDPMVYSSTLEPFQQVESPSGFRDGWAEQHAELFECTVRAIPYKGNTPDTALWWGFDGAGGWGRFIEYFNDGNEFTFFPDQTNDTVSYQCVAFQRAQMKWDTDWVAHRKASLKFRTVDGTVITGY